MTDHEPLNAREREVLKAERRWPERFAASPLWRIASVGVLAAAVAGVAVLAWVVLGSDDRDETAGFFSSIEAAVSRDGQMLHTTAEVYSSGQLTTSLEYWTDAATGAIRIHHVPINPVDTGDGIPTETEEIIAGDYRYFKESAASIKRSDAPHCEEVSGWLSALLACSAPGDLVASATVGDGDWEGTPARVLTLWYDLSADEEAGEPTPPPDLVPFYRLYVDRDDRLPLAAVWEATTAGETPDRLEWQMTFSHEFIERTPENLALVDLRALGYGVESIEPLSTLAASMPVFWLGEEYDAGEQGQSIVLYLAEPEPVYGSALSLHYKTPSGSDSLTVDMWRPNAWDASEPREPLYDSACVSVSEEELGGYTFTSYQMPQVNYPLPAPGESTEGDCLLATRRYGGMGDSGQLLTWEDENVVVVIKATDTGFFRYGDLLRETIAAAFQPYEPD